MKRFYVLCAFVLIASAGLTVLAQSQEKPFVPVTDEMLWNCLLYTSPSPRDS